jgi:NAD(P)H-quinone oxidoreductase subunit 5
MKDLFLYTCWLIPIYGLIGSILTLPWSLGIISRTGRAAAYINLLMTVLGLIHGLIAFNQIWHRETIKLAFEWVKVANLSLSLSIRTFSRQFGDAGSDYPNQSLGKFYALGYMEKDWSLARFYGLMGFFEAALGELP